MEEPIEPTEEEIEEELETIETLTEKEGLQPVCDNCKQSKLYLIRWQRCHNGFMIELFCDLCGLLTLQNLDFLEE